MRAPMMSIHTVAAGGGSMLRIRRRAVSRRPGFGGRRSRSRRATARGGPLTVTDANVMLGKIQPAHFPHVFGPGRRGSRSTPTIVAGKFAALAAEIGGGHRARAQDPRRSPKGSCEIAVANMANAIKKISVQRGYDVTEYVAVQCFGGAGGQHACLVADALGMTSVFIHPLAGVLSAYGMGLADVTRACGSRRWRRRSARPSCRSSTRLADGLLRAGASRTAEAGRRSRRGHGRAPRCT